MDRRGRRSLQGEIKLPYENQPFVSDFLSCVSDLDAKPCVADLDAHRFCRGYTNPLAVMGVALDRVLPGRNAMLATKPM